MSKHFHSLKVKNVIKETLNTVSIVFDIPSELSDKFSYEAGQYLTLKANIKGEEVRRSYSISSWKAMDQELKISSKMISGGKMSTFLFNELGVGESLDVMPPDGNFTLKEMERPLVLFAAGSGITPIMSILKKALSEGSQNINLYYGNRTSEEIIFHQELERFKEKFDNRLLVQHFLSSNGERLDSERVKSLIMGMKEGSGQAIYYICGPEGMIQGCKRALEEIGIESDKINIEYFASPKQEKQETEEVSSGEVNEVTVVLDDEEHQISLDNGESILEGAERIGIDPPFSCQSGVCTTCKAKLVSGEVEMENNFGLGQDEIDEGFVLTCIGKPKTPGVKINWDEV